jgi:hypothetical protein
MGVELLDDHDMRLKLRDDVQDSLVNSADSIRKTSAVSIFLASYDACFTHDWLSRPDFEDRVAGDTEPRIDSQNSLAQYWLSAVWHVFQGVDTPRSPGL